ncbi:putative HTH-type transcriptional regulator YafC [Nymphon striatum]|nr:putative HTH-type transcriptional regulator YafC [Nymphon striatum]
MEEGLRELAEAQTGVRPGYVEQLYTFGDRGHQNAKIKSAEAKWRSWYDFFPWEDWRKDRPAILDETIIPYLLEWAAHPARVNRIIRGLDPLSRIRISFGLDESSWDDELVLERYEMMYAAGLLSEAVVDGRLSSEPAKTIPGIAMVHDHRRILATAIARLRGKLKYRPVIFELMPEVFTLFDLQQTVESIFGREVHKQNFRRLVENAELVEPTGASQRSTGGRPAALFRFRTLMRSPNNRTLLCYSAIEGAPTYQLAAQLIHKKMFYFFNKILESYLQKSLIQAVSQKQRPCSVNQYPQSQDALKTWNNTLGFMLINRTTRHLSLTDLGTVYYNQVEEAVRAFELADQTIQQSSTKPSGKLKISALPSYANKHLYPILEKFRKQHPDIMVELMTTDIIHNLVTDNIDFAIRPTHKPPENLVAKVVDHHRMAIVCSPEYIKKFGANQ